MFFVTFNNVGTGEIMKTSFFLGVCVILVFFVSGLIRSKEVMAQQNFQSDQEIIQFLERTKHLQSKVERIESLSSFLLNRSYAGGPLGEGKEGKVDSGMLYRMDQFDCTTYVETVIALAESRNLSQFQQTMNRIRYEDAEVSFFKRNHFTSADWIPNNVKAGFFSDITFSILSQLGKKEEMKWAQTKIDKKAWIQKLFADQIDSSKVSFQGFPRIVDLPYIPLSFMFQDSETLEQLLSTIPSGVVVNVAAPNWPLADKIGTNLNISHQGLAIWKQGKLYFRHASSKEKKITDVPFDLYFKKRLDSKSIKGINILQVKPSS